MPVFSHCFDQEESLTDHVSPPHPRPLSCYFGDYHLLSVTCPDISEETHQQHREQATLLFTTVFSHGSSKRTTSLAGSEILALLLCVSDPSPFLTVFFIFHNDANELKGSKCTLRQISLSLHYRHTSPPQPSKEAMKLKRTLILKSFSYASQS